MDLPIGYSLLISIITSYMIIGCILIRLPEISNWLIYRQVTILSGLGMQTQLLLSFVNTTLISACTMLLSMHIFKTQYVVVLTMEVSVLM